MITIQNLNKLILKDINLNIKDNTLVVVKGVSGSGKSTLLSLIGTFLKPQSGSIKINNEDIIKFNDIYLARYRAKHIGFVFQDFNLFENLNLYENLLASILPLGDDFTQADTKIDIALKKINIFHKKYQQISLLSGGEKQRVAIARAIINNPDILLFDEPTASLDKKNSYQFIDILENLKKDGKTIVISTHDILFDNLSFIDQTIGIDDGKLIY